MATEEIDLFAEDDQSEERPPVEHSTYSIINKAGPGLQDQLRLADWHCRRLADVTVKESLLTEPIQEEILRLEGRLDRIRKQAQRDKDFHQGVIAIWVTEADLRNVIGKTIPLAHGTLKTRQSRGKTEVDEALVLRLATENHQEYGDLVKAVVAADRQAVRARYELRNGTCVDVQTGEVLSEPVLVQTEEPRIIVEVVPLSPGLPDEGEDDAT